MIVDMLRNDMGRIAEPGQVIVDDLFTTEQYPSLWQMTSSVRCCARADMPIYEILRALFPPASVTGAPKISAMQVIQELEDNPRHIYTGTLGFFAARWQRAIQCGDTHSIDQQTNKKSQLWQRQRHCLGFTCHCRMARNSTQNAGTHAKRAAHT